MIEKTVLNCLSGQLPVPVYMERPENPPGRYVIIEKLGGGKRNHIQSATLAIQSVAESLYQAALLNETVKTAMESAIICHEISRVELNSDYNFTNTTTREYRYQAVYDLTYY